MTSNVNALCQPKMPSEQSLIQYSREQDLNSNGTSVEKVCISSKLLMT